MATATKKSEEAMKDQFTFIDEKKEPEYKGPMVTIFIPALEDSSNGMKVDQYEHVTISNEKKETCYRVLRGERVEVPIPVVRALKERYPNI